MTALPARCQHFDRLPAVIYCRRVARHGDEDQNGHFSNCSRVHPATVSAMANFDRHRANAYGSDRRRVRHPDLPQREIPHSGGRGDKSTDVIHTDATPPRAWEEFKFWIDSATRQFYAFQTVNGHFITANNAGGLTTNTILSTATAIEGWEMFKL